MIGRASAAERSALFSAADVFFTIFLTLHGCRALNLATPIGGRPHNENSYLIDLYIHYVRIKQTFCI